MQQIIQRTFFRIVDGVTLINAAGAAQLAGRIGDGDPANTYRGRDLLNNHPIKLGLVAATTALKANIQLPDNLGTTDHHIYPGNRIRTMLRAGLLDQTPVLNQNTTRGLRLINNYLAARVGIQHLLRHQVDIDEENNALIDAYGCIYWNQHNLVMGPDRNSRGDDPGEAIDDPILGRQGDATQARYAAINLAYNGGQNDANSYVNALEVYLGLPPGNANNVIWQLANNTYSVNVNEPHSNFAGTAGYFYDSYYFVARNAPNLNP